MKKQYTEPNTKVVNISASTHLMNASQFETQVNASNGDSGSASYSRRRGSFWDDDED